MLILKFLAITGADPVLGPPSEVRRLPLQLQVVDVGRVVPMRYRCQGVHGEGERLLQRPSAPVIRFLNFADALLIFFNQL